MIVLAARTVSTGGMVFVATAYPPSSFDCAYYSIMQKPNHTFFVIFT
jgi:hypothetical protein